MENQFQELLKQIREYNPTANLEEVKKAWEFAKIAHVGQKRKSGEDFVNHPLQVAKILANWKLDTTSIVAGFLHDTVEDGGAIKDDLIKDFGESVTVLVEGVTKVTNLKLKNKLPQNIGRTNHQEIYVENLRKMLLVMANDLRVVFVKLADRLHNMSTLSAIPLNKQKENSLETLEIYAPLAERLGIGKVKGQLEDLAFEGLYPEEFKKLKVESKVYFGEAEKNIVKMQRNLLGKLAEEGVRAEVNGRRKHFYSLWKKLQRDEISGEFTRVHDLMALRILVDTIPQCYLALGVVHSEYKPVPNIGISDFIAQPKPNGYRSIHTKVFGPDGKIVEVQIRTHEMHHQAEFGLAAHWSYAQAKTAGANNEVLEKGEIRNKVTWVKQLVDWQSQMKDSEEFLNAVKFDALSHRNFVFSPKGDVFDLPTGATPVDFAYAVHTSLGKFIQSAKVDGRIVPLNYQLKSGQVVEIIKCKNPKMPSRDWLEFAKTTQAKREIRKQIES